MSLPRRPRSDRRPAPRTALRAAGLGLVCLSGLVGAGGTCGRAEPADAPVAVHAAPAPAPVGDGTGESGTAARLRVAPPALALPPALAGDDPAALARAADFVRRARDYERRALQGVGDVVQHPPLVDSARRSYAAAAVLAPDARDWLALRQLALEPDAPARARLAVAVTTPAARDQLPAADATARGRAGDLAGAADALDAAGRPGAALAARARLAFAAPAGAAGPGPDRTGLRAALLARAGAVPAGGGTAASLQALAPTAESPGESARRAAVLLDSLFAPLAPGERLTVARALAEARDPAGRARAAAAYAAALAGGAGTPDDRLAHGRLLARAGRWRDAVSAFAGVPAGTPASPVAAYERAHALLRAGDGAAARAALRQAGADFPRDSAGASARFLLAELTADDGNEAAARAEYLRLARDVPEARLAPGAAVRAGVLALAAADARAAAEAFDLAATRWPDAPEAGAARYWAGRAHAAAGDSATARARWTAAATLGAESYYGWLASRRLGRAPWTPSAGAAVARDSAADASARRAALCEQLGLSAEAGWERDWLTRWADTSTTRLLAAAAAVVETGRPGPGIRLAQRATEGGAARSADVWRLLYPLLYAGPLAREARAAGVDPALAAALVKQESNFTADAVSPVGARGLMQLMPEVGRALWRGPGAWTPALLFRPDVNLALGMRHLDDALGGWADPAYALAAYNAGASRVRRWQRQPGATDPELFVERIPYAETRDYVRVVLRNREFYRALYAL